MVLDIIREEKQRGRTVFLSSHILLDVERTCDEVVRINNGEVAFTDRLTAFAADAQQWEIEVAGWTSAIGDLLAGHLFSVTAEAQGAVTLVCAAAEMKALLHALTAFPHRYRQRAPATRGDARRAVTSNT